MKTRAEISSLVKQAYKNKKDAKVDVDRFVNSLMEEDETRITNFEFCRRLFEQSLIENSPASGLFLLESDFLTAFEKSIPGLHILVAYRQLSLDGVISFPGYALVSAAIAKIDLSVAKDKDIRKLIDTLASGSREIRSCIYRIIDYFFRDLVMLEPREFHFLVALVKEYAAHPACQNSDLLDTRIAAFLAGVNKSMVFLYDNARDTAEINALQQRQEDTDYIALVYVQTAIRCIRKITEEKSEENYKKRKNKLAAMMNRLEELGIIYNPADLGFADSEPQDHPFLLAEQLSTSTTADSDKAIYSVLNEKLKDLEKIFRLKINEVQPRAEDLKASPKLKKYYDSTYKPVEDAFTKYEALATKLDQATVKNLKQLRGNLIAFYYEGVWTTSPRYYSGYRQRQLELLSKVDERLKYLSSSIGSSASSNSSSSSSSFSTTSAPSAATCPAESDGHSAFPRPAPSSSPSKSSFSFSSYPASATGSSGNGADDRTASDSVAHDHPSSTLQRT